MELTIQYVEGVIIEEIFEQIDQEIPREKFSEGRATQTQDLDLSECLDSHQSFNNDSDTSLSNVVTKESFSTTLVQQKWFQSPFTSVTEVEPENKRNLIYWIPKEVCLVLTIFHNL